MVSEANPPQKVHLGDRHVSNVARFLGSGFSGLLEIGIFHPFDTAGKRLMNNKVKVLVPGRAGMENLQVLNLVIFKQFNEAAPIQRYVSLYRGVFAAISYKVSQRIFRFAGQPTVAEYVGNKFGNYFQSMFGRKYSKPMVHAVCGAAVGVMEVSIVPMDVIKIMRQNNPEALRDRSIYQLVVSENVRLYQGGLWTVLRNGPGSFALFGGAAFAKDKLFHLDDYNDATTSQNLAASVVGSISCIAVANPMDVVKTRMQSKNFDNPMTGGQIVKEMVRKEGFGAFFKGFTPKLIIVGPKLMFAYTSAQTLISWFAKQQALGIQS